MTNVTADAAADSESSMSSVSSVPAASSDVIAQLRGQIDALDAAIVRLVAERIQVSKRIQTARINAGGTRVEIGRERVILDRYRETLGPEGAALADAVLRVCRGAR